MRGPSGRASERPARECHCVPKSRLVTLFTAATGTEQALLLHLFIFFIRLYTIYRGPWRHAVLRTEKVSEMALQKAPKPECEVAGGVAGAGGERSMVH